MAGSSLARGQAKNQLPRMLSIEIELLILNISKAIMESVKISLADAAKARGCSIDYLLALAEAGQIDVYARIGPYSGEFKNQHGEPPSITEAYAIRMLGASDPEKRPRFRFEEPPAADLRPLVLTGLMTVGEPAYTTLLRHEVAILRTGKAVAVRVLREPGAENGVRFPFSGDEEFLLHLTEPQLVGVDQLCVIEAPQPVPTVPVTKPVSRAAAQDAAILAEIRILGWNPQAMPVFPQGMRGARGRAYASMKARDAARGIFSSQQVFDAAWQRMRNAGEICDAEPIPFEPQKKRGAPGG